MDPLEYIEDPFSLKDRMRANPELWIDRDMILRMGVQGTASGRVSSGAWSVLSKSRDITFSEARGGWVFSGSKTAYYRCSQSPRIVESTTAEQVAAWKKRRSWRA